MMCAGRSSVSMRNAATCSIRTAQLPTWASPGVRARRDRPGGTARPASSCPPRIRQSSPKSSSRLSDGRWKSRRRWPTRSTDRSTSSASAPLWTACSACSMADHRRYRAEVLEQLLIHGVRPLEHTRPELVRDFVRDLYKYEIRHLRERYLRKEFRKTEYAARVDARGPRYPVLARVPREFVEE